MRMYQNLLKIILLLIPAFLFSYPEVFSVDLSIKQIESLKEKVAPLMEISDEKLIGWIPVRSGGIYFVDCPNCNYGTQDRGRFEWSINEPYQIRCKGCGEIYPENTKYPENGSKKIIIGESKIFEFDYYQSGKRQKPYYFSSHVDWWRRVWLEESARDLSRLYTVTGEEKYARKSALILTRFAEVYPDWVIKFDYPFLDLKLSRDDGKPMKGVSLTRTSKRSWWGILEVEPLFLVEAYDLLQGWSGWNELPDPKSEQKVREDLLFGMMSFSMDREDWSQNTSQPRVGKFVIARVLQRPDYAHRALRHFTGMTNRFYNDGQYHNPSPSYMRQMRGTFESWNRYVSDYSDPEGYVDEVDSFRLDQFNLMKFDFVRRTIKGLDLLRLPNGQLLPINDTWGTPTDKKSQLKALTRPIEPFLYPGLGVAALGGGEGKDSWMVYLNFTNGRHHKHNDALSIGAYFYEKEWLSDIGYTHTRLRPWANSTMAHSTVVLDGKRSEMDSWENPGGQYPLFYEVRNPKFQVVSAESAVAYPKADRYRRTIATRVKDGKLLYVVDYFDVKGSSQGDYILLGPLSNTAEIKGALEWEQYGKTLMNEGVTLKYPKGESDTIAEGAAFGFYESIRRGLPEGSTHIQFTEADGSSLHVLLNSSIKDEIFFSKVPSVRDAKENDAVLENYRAPIMNWRRKTKENKEGFISLLFPDQSVESIKDVQFNGDGSVEVFLKDGSRDFWILREQVSSDLIFNGSFSRMEYDSHGDIVHGDIIGGDKLVIQGISFEGPGSGVGECLEGIQGDIQKGEPSALLLKGSMPETPSQLLTLYFPDGRKVYYTVKQIIKESEMLFRIVVNENIGWERKDQKLISTSYPEWEQSDSTIRYVIQGYAEF